MSAPVPAVEWLMSAYDATWHAFPFRAGERPGTDVLPGPMRALRPESSRGTRRAHCAQACLVLYGTHIPDDQRWQTGG
jgi:hypothetical protein